MKAIIIGGGIGGLTTVIALEKAGIEAHIYERAPELREVGAGISLWANAISALNELGLGDSLKARSLQGVKGALRTWDGTVLQEASYDELARRFGAAVVMLHRADLLALLTDQLRPERLHLSCECIGFVQDAASVTVRLANGETVHGDVLVGADGLHSVLRAQLFGDGPPRYAGYAAWRAVVRLDHPRMVAGETWGRGKRFGIVPVSDGRIYWYATMSGPEGERDPETGPQQHLLKLFRGWHEPIVPLIEATAQTAILRNDVYDRNPLARWGEGRATLLGDAAHPMTPNLGQGACQAIEDALVLAVCLRKSANVVAGLRDYECRRVPRTSRIVFKSRRIGEIGQWKNPLLCLLRDAAMRVTPSRMAVRQMDGVAGYRVVTAGDRPLFD